MVLKLQQFNPGSYKLVSAIGQQETASLQERVKELEKQLSEKDELMKAHTNLGMNIINAGKSRITELEKDKEKLMGLLEKAVNDLAYYEHSDNVPEHWQSFCKENGISPRPPEI